MRYELCGENGAARGGYGLPLEMLDLFTVRFGWTPSGMRGGARSGYQTHYKGFKYSSNAPF